MAACLLLANPAQAELAEFYRGPRAMAMGNAYTAVADDVDAVFYNPAGLALNRRYSFHLANPKLDVSGDIVRPHINVGTNTYEVVTDLADTFQDFNAASIANVFGRHVYGDVSVFPAVHFPGFAIGYYYSASAHLVARNLSYPMVDARYVVDRGFVAGVGHEVRGFKRGHYLRLGVSGKWIQRMGLEKIIPLSELMTADESYLEQFATDPEIGWGMNMGFQYEIPTSHVGRLVLASSWQDLGDTRFGASLAAQRPPQIRNNLAAGAAYIHHFGNRFRQGFGNFKLSAEGRHLLETEADPRLKAHLGLELELPALSIQAGVSGMALTGGVSFDFWLLRVSALTYAVENQALAFMDRERRYMLQLTLKLDLMGSDEKGVRTEDRKKYPRQVW